MAKLKKAPTINLAHKRGSLIDRFIIWALTLGRLIIMITFIVGLSAFGYRISLDWKLIDLNDKIKQKQAIVELLKADEKKYRNLQDRLTAINQLSNKANDTFTTFTEIIDMAPPDILFDNVSFNTNRMQIDTRARSIIPLANFITLLRKYPSLQSLQINKIENKTSTATILVGIIITLKPK